MFNPSAGVHKKLPLSPFDKLIVYRYGFGYDQSTDDYLVVSMSYEYERTTHLEFFSLRDNAWKEIESTRFPYMNSSILSYVNGNRGLLYNGAIHWSAFRHDLKRYVIVTFGLKERKFEEMHFPDDYISIYDPCIDGLWVFGEFLIVWDPRYSTIEIWVMKEYKMHSSWTKIVLPTAGLRDEYFVPLCSTKSGDIIGTDDGKRLVKYNDRGELLDHSYCNYPCGFQAGTYIESLFSLPADNEQA
jgi:F-box interacting protein